MFADCEPGAGVEPGDVTAAVPMEMDRVSAADAAADGVNVRGTCAEDSDKRKAPAAEPRRRARTVRQAVPVNMKDAAAADAARKPGVQTRATTARLAAAERLAAEQHSAQLSVKVTADRPGQAVTAVAMEVERVPAAGVAAGRVDRQRACSADPEQRQAPAAEPSQRKRTVRQAMPVSTKDAAVDGRKVGVQTRSVTARNLKAERLADEQHDAEHAEKAAADTSARATAGKRVSGHAVAAKRTAASLSAEQPATALPGRSPLDRGGRRFRL